MPALAHPLTDDEIELLDGFLCSLNHGKAMKIEEMDGFICALICSTDRVPPSEYLPHVWGGELVQGPGFKTIEELQCVMSLLTRHRKHIAETLLRGDVYVPMVFKGEDGIALGNEWAIGFEQGMHLRRDSWEKLVNDEEHRDIHPAGTRT